MNIESKVSLIAFYLPQYHPIPENDNWWGKGFTEWNNVTKAKPLYRGHKQPKLPADLGYYDLRLPEARQAQADLAREYGLTAFCYWHYWFGNGKRILERPFSEVLTSGKPDFPFCLAWANQTWTGVWHGENNRVLIKQEYFGVRDYEQHFYALLPAFADSRYLKVNNQPVFLVYNPWDIPEPKSFVGIWQDLALKEGLTGIYFIGIDQHQNLNKYNMQGSTWHEPVSHSLIKETFLKESLRSLGFHQRPLRYDYSELVRYALNDPLISDNHYPVIVPNWDNTPRSGKRGLVYESSTPELFGEYLMKAIRLVSGRPADHRIVFIKSWNEWAEGNYLEPDMIHGKRYLEVLKRCTS